MLKLPVAANCWVRPITNEGFTGVTATETSPFVFPLPASAAVCGLLPAVSVTVSVPFCVPVFVETNVKLTMHLFLPAIVPPQEFVCAKLPVMAMVEIVTAVFRLLVSVKFRGGLVVPTVTLPNPRLVGEMDTGSTPAPERATDCGLLEALPVTVRLALALLTVLGLKVRLMVHFAPAPKEFPQPLLWANGVLAVMLERISFAVPVLVSVIFLTALVVATAWFPNAKVVGDSDMV